MVSDAKKLWIVTLLAIVNGNMGITVIYLHLEQQSLIHTICNTKKLAIQLFIQVLIVFFKSPVM